MRVVRLINEPDWKSLLSPIEEIFFATSPSAKTLRPDERQPRSRSAGWGAILGEAIDPRCSTTDGGRHR
jgi:hypothetical protein